MVCSFNDITRQRQTDLQLMFQATHDPLTGLANRGVLLAELQRRLDRTAETGGQVGLLFIDVDRFKAVNDTPRARERRRVPERDRPAPARHLRPAPTSSAGWPATSSW